jgi:uncharacterized membrane protein (DUF373 family)
MEWLRRIIIEEDYHRLEMVFLVALLVGLAFAVMMAWFAL